MIRADDAHAVRYYREYLEVRHSRRARLAGALGSSLGGALGGIARRAMTGPWPAAHRTDAEAIALTTDVARALGVDARDARIGILVRDYAGNERSRAVAFLFRPGGASPWAVLKTRPADAAGLSLEAERRALASLTDTLPPTLRQTIPRALAFGAHAGHEALLTSALAGRSGYVELHQALRPARLAARHLDGAVRWLLAFQRATSRAVPARGDDALPSAQPGSADPQLAEAIAEAGDRHRRAPLRRVAAHGDYWARNVLYSAPREAGGADDVRVIDWEHHAPDGSPVVDLLQLLVSYGMDVHRLSRRAGIADAFELTFDSKGTLAVPVRTAIREWCELHGVSPGVVRDALLLDLAGRASAAGRHGNAALQTEWIACCRRIAAGNLSAFSG